MAFFKPAEPRCGYSLRVIETTVPKGSFELPSSANGDGSKPWYLVNPKIAGKWMFIPLKMVSIGIDPYPNLLAVNHMVVGLSENVVYPYTQWFC